MQVANPADWIIERLERRTPVFCTRINDGEMIQMFRTEPEGKELGTVANKAWCHWELGDAYRRMLDELTGLPDDAKANVLVGHCCHDDPYHELNRLFWDEYGDELEGCDECHLDGVSQAKGHWPLEGVVDGSTIRLLEWLGQSGKAVVLVTCDSLKDAAKCLDYAPVILSPEEDSWTHRDSIKLAGEFFAGEGFTFVWCAGAGLKPTAWQLWREFPQSSHIDLGHLFNGAFGMTDYGWLQRRDGPWWEPYMRAGGFKDWVRGFLP